MVVRYIYAEKHDKEEQLLLLCRHMNRYFRTLIIAFLCTLFLCNKAYNQQLSRVEALNQYVSFNNESIHGLLIVHRLLENFNLEINKYVDLDSYQINFYSNKDLPQNIFLDAENWFYDTSPEEWYEKITSSKGVLDARTEEKLMGDASRMREIYTSINQKRFDVENIINTQDLEDKDQLKKVYDELELCVSLYQSFYNAQRRMESTLYTLEGLPESIYYLNLKRIYDDMRALLSSVRHNPDKSLSSLISRGKRTLEEINIEVVKNGNESGQTFHINNIFAQAEKGIAASQKYNDKTRIPEEYLMYGSQYYAYNADIINKFNRYGSGVVSEMNMLLESADAEGLRFTELPHYYKVIYPRKLVADPVETIETASLEEIPPDLEGRKLIKKNEEGISVSNTEIEVEIYDHSVQDGDIISLNFNGAWVIENHKLTREPYRLKLTLNPDGTNFLVLHAINLGQRPPNTMALRYYVDGKRKQYVMNSNLNASEVIEIKVK